MAKTKQKRLAQIEVESLTGLIQGQRFKVKLDDLKIGDKWTPNILPLLASDKIGRSELADGYTTFVFADAKKSTIHFVADAGNLVISKFTEEGFEVVDEIDDDKQEPEAPTEEGK